MTRLLACLLLVIAVACSPGAAPIDSRAPALVKATPAPTPTSVPTPTAPEPLPQAPPLTVSLDEIQVVDTSNSAMFAASGPTVDDPTALAAAQQAVAIMQPLLNRLLIDRQTLLSAEGLLPLIDPALLDDAGAGLGVLARDDLLGTANGSAAATAQVLISGVDVGTVTLFWTATVDVFLQDASGPLTQQGVVSFVPRDGTLRLVAIEANSTFGGDLPVVLG